MTLIGVKVGGNHSLGMSTVCEVWCSGPGEGTVSDIYGSTLEGVGENSPSATGGESYMMLASSVTSNGTICDIATWSVCDVGTIAAEW